MPSIQQIIAEIQLAPDLPPNHKVKAVQIIRDAEQRLKLKGVNSKPRKPSGKNLMTLQEWEEQYGLLQPVNMTGWAASKKLCPRMLADMISEFRTEMMAKGKQYANFKMAFQTYLAKGYLSKTITACMLERSPYKTQTTLDNRGVTL